MKTKNTCLALLVVLAVAALAAGCGTDDRTSASGNATDAGFITDMTAHHQSAIDLAEVATQRAEHPQLRKLAHDIVDVQEAEISVMRRIADDMHSMGMRDGGHMGLSQSDMGMGMDVPKRAGPFDRAFIDMMVAHHLGAITMANKQLADGTQPALRQMANSIIDEQAKEIVEMRRWRKQWHGSAPTATNNGGGSHHATPSDG